MSKSKMNCLISYCLSIACIHITYTITTDKLWTDIGNKLTITNKLLESNKKKLK